MKLALSRSSNEGSAPAKSPYRPLRNSLISIFSIIAFTGCLASSEGPVDIGTSEHNALGVNALGVNALGVNALGVNALGVNALTTGTLSSDTFELNASVAGDLPHTESGRELLQYIVRCALDDGDFLLVRSGQRAWRLPGMLGMATSWKDTRLTPTQQQIMSGCLLAHVNAFGTPVSISLRHRILPAASADEAAAYYHGDGAFYGDVFTAEAKKFACKIRANEVYDPETGLLAPASGPDSDLRICAGEDTAEECDFAFAGYCEDVCATVISDGYQWRFEDCRGTDGVVYPEAVTVWLEGGAAESCDTAPIGYTCDPN